MLSILLKKQSRIILSLLFIIPIIIILIFPLESINGVIVVHLMDSMLIVFSVWAFFIGEKLLFECQKFFKISVKKYNLYILIIITIAVFISLISILQGFIKTFSEIELVAFLLFFIVIAFSFSFINVLYLIAKCIVSLEIKKEALFSQFSGTFVQMIFFPLTIWFIYIRIQKILITHN